MTPSDRDLACAGEFYDVGGDGMPLRPRWTEHPPGVLRSIGWLAWQEIEAMTAPKGNLKKTP